MTVFIGFGSTNRVPKSFTPVDYLYLKADFKIALCVHATPIPLTPKYSEFCFKKEGLSQVFLQHHYELNKKKVFETCDRLIQARQSAI